MKKEYESNLAKYKSDRRAYEQRLAAREKQITEGKKQVEQLNARFNDWYYVISAENFNKLHLLRKDLVKEKAKSPGDDTKNDKKPGTPSGKDPFSLNDDKEEDDQDSPEKNADKVEPEKTPAGKKPAKKVDE